MLVRKEVTKRERYKSKPNALNICNLLIPAFFTATISQPEFWGSSLIHLLNLYVAGGTRNVREDKYLKRYFVLKFSQRSTRNQDWKISPIPHLKIRAESQKTEHVGSVELPCLEAGRVALEVSGEDKVQLVKMVEECSNTVPVLCGLLLTSGKRGWCIMLWSLQMETDQISTECYFYPRPQSAVAAPDAASGGIIHPASTCRSLCSLSEVYLGISIYSHWMCTSVAFGP